MNNEMPKEMTKKIVRAIYTNYKGETKERTFVPEYIYFGSTEWHPEEQWLMVVYDLDKEELRTYALKDIKEWRNKNV